MDHMDKARYIGESGFVSHPLNDAKQNWCVVEEASIKQSLAG